MRNVKISVVIILVLLSILTPGCTSFDNLIKEDEYGGRAQVYPIDKTLAWETAKTVFRQLGAKEDDIEENHVDSFVTWVGSMMAIIERVDNNNTRVISVLAPCPCAPAQKRPTERDFHKHFAQILDTVKGGKSLPAIPQRR
jgi:hypothetical protein